MSGPRMIGMEAEQFAERAADAFMSRWREVLQTRADQAPVIAADTQDLQSAPEATPAPRADVSLPPTSEADAEPPVDVQPPDDAVPKRQANRRDRTDARLETIEEGIARIEMLARAAIALAVENNG